MTNGNKPEFTKMFLRGKALADCCEFFGVRESTGEQVLREAITQLAELNTTLHTTVLQLKDKVPQAPEIVVVN